LTAIPHITHPESGTVIILEQFIVPDNNNNRMNMPLLYRPTDGTPLTLVLNPKACPVFFLLIIVLTINYRIYYFCLMHSMIVLVRNAPTTKQL
jgi:hypothetical protein